MIWNSTLILRRCTLCVCVFFHCSVLLCLAQQWNPLIKTRCKRLFTPTHTHMKAFMCETGMQVHTYIVFDEIHTHTHTHVRTDVSMRAHTVKHSYY